MTANLIDLGRRFRPATEKEDDRPFRGLFDDGLRSDGTWSDLLEQRRVVVLAEAGSGKSSEFRSQRDALRAKGSFAFTATVRDVASVGLEAALPSAERRTFAQWRADLAAKCWLFIDSVDEAKDQGHHFESAVRNLEQAIAGLEDRAHVYISSRFTDWDRTADREAFEAWLAIPQPPPPPPDIGEEVRATLQRRDREPRPSAEEIAVFVLEPLSKRQVRRFAAGSGIVDVDALLQAIENENLWSFAARPLDLNWIVDFWRTHRRLGSLREMIEESVKARLLDPDTRRRRSDPLALASAGQALNRIGAGFLLCGKDTLRVPAAGVDLEPSERSMPMDALLPEWSDGNRLLLLGRPVFDPATLGRARLHNDNEGTLRFYLFARWLERLLAANCPIGAVHDLLFADLYGYRLVRPEMVEPSAWLAGRVPVVADELISRAPFNLLRYGDPGSLPIPIRMKVFEAALKVVGSVDPDKLCFLDENLRRFTDPALDPHVPSWWNIAREDDVARHLLLRLIHLGRLSKGLDVVREVAFDGERDEISRLIAVRGLVAIGDDADRARYADHVVSRPPGMSRSLVLQALDLLFPAHIGVEQFFALIDAIGVADTDGHASILPVGPELPVGLTAPSELQWFLEKIVARSGDLVGEGERERPFLNTFANIAATAACRLLESHPDDVPPVVTDLVLLLHEARHHNGVKDVTRSLDAAFSTSPGRRRTSFWRAVDRLRGHPWAPYPSELNIWSVQHLGWPVTVTESDLDWLIEDVRLREDPRDRWTALQAAHSVWRQSGEDASIRTRMEEAVSGDAELSRQLAAWNTPQPDPPERVAQMAHFEEMRRRNEERTAERDDSWIEMIETLRADPTFFDTLSPQTEDTVDSRLFHLWQFVSWRTPLRSRHTIDGLDVVEPIFGAELTRRLGQALIEFAYARTPSSTAGLTSAPPRHSNFDIMALGGMSLAAATIPNWASGLDDTRVEHAARLALIELNGLPDFLISLANVHPKIVRTVLMGAIEAQLKQADPNGHGILDRLEYADVTFARLIVPDLVRHIEAHASLSPAMLQKIVSVLIRATPLNLEGLSELMGARIRDAEDPIAAAYYALVLFAVDGDGAVDALQEKMAGFDSRGQADLCCTLLPRLFGDRYH